MKLSKMLSQRRAESRMLAIEFAPCLVAAFGGHVLGQSTKDASLNAVRMSDRADRSKTKVQLEITAAEHMRRAAIYLANRAFAAARELGGAVIDIYPSDRGTPAALFGMARSYCQER